jgi:hypothetical protein
MAKTTLNYEVMENIEKFKERLSWPDLTCICAENTEDLYRQISSASEYNLDELTGGAEIKFLIDRGNIPERLDDKSNEPIEYLSPDEVQTRIDDQLAELREDTSELFFRISTLTTQAGPLSKLQKVERLLIETIIEKALNFGKWYGGAVAIGHNSETLASKDDLKIHGGKKNEAVREAALKYLKPFYDKDPNIKQSVLEIMLETESTNNPEKYGGSTIPRATRIRYARHIMDAKSKQ